MTCYRIQGDWHSYVKKSLSELELHEMSTHLARCSQCHDIVSSIMETSYILTNCRTVPSCPTDIKLNVMSAINKSKYKKGVSHTLFALKNLGLSMVAAGLILFAINLTPLPFSLENRQVFDINNYIGRQLAMPFDRIGLGAHEALGKIDSLKQNYLKKISN
jgi:hypothetical protein